MSKNRGLAIALLIALACLTAAAPAQATLKFYYDPVTGNVSFDSSEARGGNIHAYGLYTSPTLYPFRTENRIRLSSSTLYINTVEAVDEITLGSPWDGLYTLGNILPAGISQAEWTSMFTPFRDSVRGVPGIHVYVDLVGQGDPPPATFIYGAPAGEFKNRLDLIDPNSLTWAENATLRYFEQTGEVQIDTRGLTGGYITAILLRSANAFKPDEFTSQIPLGPLGGVGSSEIAMLVDLIEPGAYSLGAILPANLTLAQLTSTLSTSQFLGRAGFRSRSFDFETNGQAMQIAYVAAPEPAGLVMASVLMAFAPWRKRRSST